MANYGSWVSNEWGKYSIVLRPYGSQITTTSSHSGLVHQKVWSRSGTSTPSWGKLSKRTGFFPVNNFSFQSTTTGSWQGVYSETTGLSGKYSESGTYVRSGWIPEPPEIGELPGSLANPVPATVLARLDGHTVQDLLGKIKSQKINLVQAYAERAQTARTISETATNIAKALIALKKGDLGGAARSVGIHVGKRAQRAYRKGFRKGSRMEQQTESLARGWLAVQYGVKPLMSDIFGACETLANVGMNPQSARVYAKNTRVETTDQSVRGLAPNQPTTGAQYRKQGETEYTVQYVCYFTYALPGLTDLARLGITNPALIAWELMPYSFVFDWFLPVGGWLSSFDATLGLTFVSGSRTVFIRNKCTTTSIQPGAVASNRRYFWSCSKKAESISCVREKLDAFPMPYFPDFKNPFSWSHLTSALALLKTATK